MALNRLQHRERVKTVHQHGGRTREHRDVDAHHHARNVIQRRNRQQHIIVADAIAVGRRGRFVQGVAISQHGTLGQAGGARGVGHQRDVVHGQRHRRRRGRALGGRHEVFHIGRQRLGLGFHRQQFGGDSHAWLLG